MDRNVEKGNMFSVVWFKYVLSSRIVCLLWYSKGMNPHLERYSLFRGWDYVATVWCLLATQCHWKNFHQKSNCRRRGCVMLLPQATAMIDKPMRYDALLLYIYICIYTPTISIMYIKLCMTLKENNTARPTMQQLQNGYFFSLALWSWSEKLGHFFICELKQFHQCLCLWSRSWLSQYVLHGMRRMVDHLAWDSFQLFADYVPGF